FLGLPDRCCVPPPERDVDCGKRGQWWLPHAASGVDAWALMFWIQHGGRCQRTYGPNICFTQPGANIASDNPVRIPDTDVADPRILQHTRQGNACPAQAKHLERCSVPLCLELVLVMWRETTKFATFKNRSDTT